MIRLSLHQRCIFLAQPETQRLLTNVHRPIWAGGKDEAVREVRDELCFVQQKSKWEELRNVQVMDVSREMVAGCSHSKYTEEGKNNKIKKKKSNKLNFSLNWAPSFRDFVLLLRPFYLMPYWMSPVGSPVPQAIGTVLSKTLSEPPRWLCERSTEVFQTAPLHCPLLSAENRSANYSTPKHRRTFTDRTHMSLIQTGKGDAMHILAAKVSRPDSPDKHFSERNTPHKRHDSQRANIWIPSHQPMQAIPTLLSRRLRVLATASITRKG